MNTLSYATNSGEKHDFNEQNDSQLFKENTRGECLHLTLAGCRVLGNVFYENRPQNGMLHRAFTCVVVLLINPLFYAKINTRLKEK